MERVPRARAWPPLVSRLGDIRPELVVPAVRGEPQMSAPLQGRRYVLITPCRDEAEFARRTLESVVTQSVQPALWVIVDDGSKDATPTILAEYAGRFDFIRI